MKKTEICIVIPWFGMDLKGGAEQLAWQIATRLVKKGITVTILTTCVENFLSDWSVNFYKKGDYIESGIKIKRFEVLKRDDNNFDKINQKLINIGNRSPPNPILIQRIKNN